MTEPVNSNSNTNTQTRANPYPHRQAQAAMGGSSEDFSVVVLASDLAVDARPFLAHQQQQHEEEEAERWHECSQHLSPDEDFSDLELLQFVRLQGSDKNGNRILRVVGKYFPGNNNP